MSFSEITYAVAGAVATITLNRPEQLNAWTRVMEGEVREAMNAAANDNAARVIVLTGAGRGFCAGADMNLLSDVSAERGAGQDTAGYRRGGVDNGLDLPPDFHLRYSYFPTVPKPIIAAINGPAAGLGLIMSLYCDIRLASDKAVFTTAFSRRGLIAEHGISWLLPALVGPANALDLLLSARKIDAAEAYHMGLVNQLAPAAEFAQAVHAYATDMAVNVSPRSMRVMKQQVYLALQQSLESATLTANAEMPASFASEDFREGVAHFVDKRLPHFSGK